MRGRANARVILLLAALAAALFVGYQFFYQWTNLRALKAQKAELQKELAVVEQKNDDLQKDIDASNTDGFVERMARELLGWVKPGEIKIVGEGGE